MAQSSKKNVDLTKLNIQQTARVDSKNFSKVTFDIKNKEKKAFVSTDDVKYLLKNLEQKAKDKGYKYIKFLVRGIGIDRALSTQVDGLISKDYTTIKPMNKSIDEGIQDLDDYYEGRASNTAKFHDLFKVQITVYTQK